MTVGDHRRSRVRRVGIRLFVLLVPIALWTLWDYIEARRLSRAVAEIRRRGEPVTTILGKNDAANAPRNAARFYDAAGALLDRQELYGPTGATSISAALRFGREDRAVTIQRIRQWLEHNQEAERLLDLGTDLEFTGFQPGTEYNYRFDRMYGLASLADMRRIERVDARDGDGAARAIVRQLRVARAGNASVFGGDTRSFTIERALTELGAVLEAHPSANALAQLASALAEHDRDSAIEEAALGSRAYLIDSFWSASGDWYGRPSIRFSGNPLEPVAYFVLRPWFGHKVNAELRLMNAAVEQARKPWPERVTFQGRDPSQIPGRVLVFRFDHPMQVVSHLHGRQALGLGRMLAALRTSAAAVAVERYRLAHDGAMPSTLDAVVPTLLPKVPIDPFSGAPLKYKTGADGHVVYSFGTNQKDDGGTQLKGPPPKTGTRDQLDAAPDIGVQVTLRKEDEK